jgi:hypothetical protein
MFSLIWTCLNEYSPFWRQPWLGWPKCMELACIQSTRQNKWTSWMAEPTRGWTGNGQLACLALVEKSRLKHHTFKNNPRNKHKDVINQNEGSTYMQGDQSCHKLFSCSNGTDRYREPGPPQRWAGINKSNHASSCPCRQAERSAHAPVSGMRAERGPYEDEEGTNKNRYKETHEIHCCSSYTAVPNKSTTWTPSLLLLIVWDWIRPVLRTAGHPHRQLKEQQKWLVSNITHTGHSGTNTRQKYNTTCDSVMFRVCSYKTKGSRTAGQLGVSFYQPCIHLESFQLVRGILN